MRYLFSSILCALAASTMYAQTPQQLKSYLPPIEGWSIMEKTEIFTPENLFDRINGAAPLFIENNFREMTSMEYEKGEDRITIQAYRHATPQDAFGMYASERSSDLRFFPIGGEAQGDDKSLYFFAGHVYFKMWTNTEEDVAQALQAIGSALASKTDMYAAYPFVLSKFPKENKIQHTEAYITANYIGHQFLKSVYITDYKNGDGKYQIFVVDGNTPEGARNVLKEYFNFTKQPADFAQGELTVKDRFNGDMPVVWKGKYIVGIFSEGGQAPAGAVDIIKELAAKL